jgi:hypothetical protein
MNKSQLETLLRNEFLELVSKAIEDNRETDVLRVSTSEIAIPCLNAEGNETWVIVKVSVPRGTRNGNGYDPYDGYAAAEDYQIEQADKAEKKAAADAKKQAKIAKDQKAREEKKALAEANKGLKELRKIDITPKGE